MAIIRAFLSNLISMLKNKSGKVSVSYFLPRFSQINDQHLETRCIDNFTSPYSNISHERIVVPKDWSHEKAMLELAKKESEQHGLIGKIKYHFFKKSYNPGLN